MSKEAYVRLCTHFRHKLWLHDSRHVSVEEKMAMFLTIMGHNERYVVIKRRFQHYSKTIHTYFQEVLAAMMTFAREMIILELINHCNGFLRYFTIQYFIFGVLDGTLVHAIIPSSQQTVYRGRGKGKCYQNILGICDFNMIFTFVYAGWEGVAHDSRVLTEVMAIPSNNFPFTPPSKYYLCDVAYTNTREFMAPRNVRYWLGDFHHRRAITKEEKINHSHAKLRNVIERAYGLKGMISKLDKMAPYPFNVQRNIVIACFAVNNFRMKEKINDELFA
ncbi:LOW QUALITY PROTEIN: DDE_4 domain-containing protein, partial [Cephalotus follicularis]